MEVQWLQLCEVGAARQLFSKSHLKMEKILDFMYYWAKDAPMIHAAEEAEVSIGHMAVDWCNFMRKVCAIWVDLNRTIPL